MRGTTAVVALGLVVLASAPRQARAQAQQADIIETARAAGNFTTLLRAIDAAGLTETLKGPGPFTVFAPTDEAFNQLPAGTLDEMLDNPDRLRDVLRTHIVAARVPASELTTVNSVMVVTGERVPVEVADGENAMKGPIRVGGARVVTADVMASNGIIHAVDRVIMPGHH